MNHGPIGLQPIALPLSYTPWLKKLPRQLQTVVQLTNWTGPSKCTADKAACNCKGHRKCCYFLLRNILSIKICSTKKARRDSWDLGRKMHSQTVMSRVIWFCEAVAKLFFLFLWRRQFQLDWTLFGRFDSTHFYGRDSSHSSDKDSYLLPSFFISPPFYHGCRAATALDPQQKTDLTEGSTLFFSVQLHMEDRWLLKKITWH